MNREDHIILAPAGTRDAVTAAVRCGADAIYLGAKNFNARRNADNFDNMELPETVAWCHGRGTKVFVTVNTLVMDSEMALLEEEAELVASSGADAVIIQDPAVMRLFRDRYPGIPRHASTQTVVHDLEGAKLLEDAGYETVLLARELTLKEMETICKGISVRTEAFVHGAHCMAVSGACYLSGMLGGRSGNRGLCAQPCRLDWHCGGREFALSLKDMSLMKRVRDMAEIGVGTFKIEGRMKRPEYVAAVVTACKQALAGEAYDEEALRAVFSRSGFTGGYLEGKRDKSMFGYRTKEDVVGADKVLGTLANLYRNENPRVGVDMRFTLGENGGEFTVTDSKYTVAVSVNAPEAAINRSLDEENAKKNLIKTGGTPFFVENFAADIAPGLTMPASGLNALRREALDKLLAERSALKPWPRQEHAPAPAPEKRDKNKEPALWARFANAGQMGDGAGYEKILLPLHTLTPALIQKLGDRLIGELPAVVWPEDEPAFAKRLEELRDMGLKAIMTGNIYGVNLGRRLGLAVYGGAGLNVLNTETLRWYEELGLESVTASYELAMSKIKALGGTKPLGIVAYGRLPLMHFRNCPVKASIGCAKCGGKGELTDRMNVKFPVECTEKKYSTMVNSVPLHIAERDMRGLDYAILHFTTETAADCRRVAEDYRLRRKGAGQRTGGLYYRELL